MHRGITLRNLLLDDDMRLHITTFRHITMCHFKEWRHGEVPGRSKDYQPPEMLKNEAYSDRDYAPWCLGVIIFTLLTGKLPFHNDDPFMLRERAE